MNIFKSFKQSLTLILAAFILIGSNVALAANYPLTAFNVGNFSPRTIEYTVTLNNKVIYSGIIPPKKHGTQIDKDWNVTIKAGDDLTVSYVDHDNPGNFCSIKTIFTKEPAAGDDEWHTNRQTMRSNGGDFLFSGRLTDILCSYYLGIGLYPNNFTAGTSVGTFGEGVVKYSE